MAQGSLETQLLNQSEVEASVQAFIHAWTPHSTLTVTGASIGVFVIAMLCASFKRGTRALGLNDLARVGFAAGPIPIYLLLPLAPYDPDLTAVLLDHPFQLMIAAIVGLIWTGADIRKIVSGRQSGPGNKFG